MFVYDSGESLTAQEIAVLTTTGKMPKGHMSDYKSTSSGILFSVASRDTSSNDALVARLYLAETIKSFLQFFDKKCPVGGLHDWGGASPMGGACKKCGRSGEKPPDSYYLKYRDAYVQARDEPLLATRDAIQKMISANRATGSVVSVQTHADEIPALIATVAGTFSVDKHLLERMGVPGAVKQSVLLANEPIISQYRAERLSGYMREIISTFNIIKNSANMVKVPGDISTVIGSLHGKEHALAPISCTFDNPPNADAADRINIAMFAILTTIKNMPQQLGEWFLKTLMHHDLAFCAPETIVNPNDYIETDDIGDVIDTAEATDADRAAGPSDDVADAEGEFTGNDEGADNLEGSMEARDA
jgi:hypothetical protein